MNLTLRVVVAVAASQVVLVGIYWLVESGRTRHGGSGPALGVHRPQRVDERIKPLWVGARDGRRLNLRTLQRPTLVHFWASWCPPCRKELPALLALPDTHPLDVVAAALDREWADVDRFLGGPRRTTVFLADTAEVEAALGVRTLPVTFLVEPGGWLALRFEGARDWTDSAFLGTWIREVDHE